MVTNIEGIEVKISRSINLANVAKDWCARPLPHPTLYMRTANRTRMVKSLMIVANENLVSAMEAMESQVYQSASDHVNFALEILESINTLIGAWDRDAATNPFTRPDVPRLRVVQPV